MSRAGVLRVGLIAAAVVAAVIAALFLPLDAGVTHVHSEIDIARSPHDVYDYVSTPSTWPRWHPSSIAVSGDAGHSLAIGESVVEEFTVAGQHGFATWRVVRREPDRLWQIEGRIDGRVAGTVTYTLSARPGGTHFVRDFDYPSRSLLFALVNAVMLHARVVDESQRALVNLQSVLNATSNDPR